MSTKSSESAGKLTQREYAAIHLAVPDSGAEWLDEMIRKSSLCREEQRHEETAPEVPAQGVLREESEAPKPETSKAPQGPKDPPKGGKGQKVG